MRGDAVDDANWGLSAPKCEPLEWQPVWSDERHGRWQVEEATRTSDGWTRPNLRLVLGDEEHRLTGAACVCVRHDGPEPRVLLVEQDRPAPGVRLWEVPSGMVDDTDATPAASALRELGEETGVEATFVADLGEIYPDPGVFAASVQVVLAHATPVAAEKAGAAAADDEGPEVERARWFTSHEVDDLVASGGLRCGVSLSALTVARTWQQRQDGAGLEKR